MTYPLPEFYDRSSVGQVLRVPYQQRSHQAQQWAVQHSISPASHDKTRIALLAIDVQNTFCIPEFELFVGGSSGQGAVDDTARLCEFVYQRASERLSNSGEGVA